MANIFLMPFAIVLTLNLLMGLIRIMRGPTFVDRMLAIQLMGTTSICVLLIALHVGIAEPDGEGPFLGDCVLYSVRIATRAGVGPFGGS